MTLFCLRAAGVHYPRMSWPAHAIALSGLLTCFATVLVGCSSGHHQEVSIANLPPEPTPAQLSLPPPSAPQALAPKSLASQPSPPQPSKGPIRAAQIMKLLSGK